MNVLSVSEATDELREAEETVQAAERAAYKASEAARHLVGETKVVTRIDAEIADMQKRLEGLGRERSEAIRAVELQAERVILADAGKAAADAAVVDPGLLLSRVHGVYASFARALG